MRVAVCICGEYRTWDRCAKNVISSLSVLNADFFFATWDKCHSTGKQITETQIIKTFSDNGARSRLKKCKVFDHRSVLENVPDRVDMVSWQMANMWHHVNYLKREFEYDHDFRYDAVILMRSDIVFCNADTTCHFDLAELRNRLKNTFSIISNGEGGMRALDKHFGMTQADWVYCARSALMDVICGFRDHLGLSVDADNRIPDITHNSLVDYFFSRKLAIDTRYRSIANVGIVRAKYDGNVDVVDHVQMWELHDFRTAENGTFPK